MKPFVAILTVVAALSTASANTALAAPQGPAAIFADAGLLPKIIMLALMTLIVAAIAICVRKLMAGPRLSGGSIFLSSLRAGGPLLGLVGGLNGFINNAMAISANGPQPLQVLMPGIVENLSMVMLGLIAGVVAVVAHWAVEARIDRAVLQA